MFKPHFKAAATALGFALAASVANAGPNLVSNGDFSSPPSSSTATDWTQTLYSDAKSYNYFYKVVSTSPDGQYPAIYSYGATFCQLSCPAGQSNSLSQQINNLTYGDQYQLSFWVGGYYYDYDTGYGPTGATTASVDGQVLKSVTLPTGSIKDQKQWTYESLIFTYLGTTGSALLDFTRHFRGVANPLTCVPCGNYEFEVLTNVSLMDLGSSSSVSEPGTLGVIALGLGALGLFYNRRRNGACRLP